MTPGWLFMTKNSVALFFSLFKTHFDHFDNDNQLNGQQPEWLVMITNLMAHSTHNTPRPPPVPAPNTEVERTRNHCNFEISRN